MSARRPGSRMPQSRPKARAPQRVGHGQGPGRAVIQWLKSWSRVVVDQCRQAHGVEHVLAVVGASAVRSQGPTRAGPRPGNGGSAPRPLPSRVLLAGLCTGVAPRSTMNLHVPPARSTTSGRWKGWA